LNFIDCPLFKVGMCTADCTGKVRVKNLAQHVAADLSLTTRLVDVICELRETLVGDKEGTDENYVRKRPREEYETTTSTDERPEQNLNSMRELFVEALGEKVFIMLMGGMGVIYNKHFRQTTFLCEPCSAISGPPIE
jgi:hypothetical protein